MPATFAAGLASALQEWEAMVILQALLTLLTRSAGKLLNTAFGWATVMLFGRVSKERQIYLSIIAFGSVLWIVALISLAAPGFGTFLLTFVTLPKWVDKRLIRLAMTAAVLVIPALVGLVSLLMLEPGARPRGAAAKVATVMRGYPYTVGLAMTLVMMTVFAPALKVRNLARRWETQHVPMLVKPDDYLTVVEEVQAALRTGGIPTTRATATWMLRLPTKFLSLFARYAMATAAADHLTRLVAPEVEILLHPSDLVISGRERAATRARAILAERLTVTRAYLTWDKESTEVEDRIREIWQAMRDGRMDEAAATLAAVQYRLRELDVPYDEWEVLFREALLAETALLRGRMPSAARAA